MAEMSPAEAASALRELEGYEEHLGQRLGGITIMVWGTVAAAIVLAYGVAVPWLQAPQQAALSLLWLPFVLAGGVITQRLWQQHVVAFGGQDTSARDTLLITAAFLVVGFLVFSAARAAGIAWNGFSIMAAVNGLVAAGMSLLLRRQGARGWSHLFSAGLAMVLGGALLGILEMAPAPSALASAAIVGASWFTAGFAIHLQG